MSSESKIEKKIIFISNGNPGALNVMGEIMKSFGEKKMMEIINILISKNIVGSNIWVLYKESDKDINKFINNLL